MATVNAITVTFSKGSFQEWCEASGDEYTADEISKWESNYNAVIEKRLTEAFPGASISVGEGYDQTMGPKIDIDFEADEDEWGADEDLKMEIEHLIDVGSSGELMDRIFS